MFHHFLRVGRILSAVVHEQLRAANRKSVIQSEAYLRAPLVEPRLYVAAHPLDPTGVYTSRLGGWTLGVAGHEDNRQGFDPWVAEKLDQSGVHALVDHYTPAREMLEWYLSGPS